MRILPRTFQGDTDRRLMRELVCISPSDSLHTVDLPYRLSSWALDAPENVGLWEDEAGDLLAWAVMQTPFWVIDCAYRADAPADMYRRILNWAEERATAARDTPYGHPAWFVNVFRHQDERIRDLEAAGFGCQEDVGENSWSKALLQYQAPSEFQVAPPPPGFVIRPSKGGLEAAEYVRLHRAAFGSENMTESWRRRVIEQPEYAPDLDLVVIAPDGRPAGFCVCWFDTTGPNGCPSGQIEPMGVNPDFQRHGLGHALLTAAIRRLRKHGAEQIYVESDTGSDAFAFYTSVGFQVLRAVLVFRKDCRPNNAST